MPTYEYECQKCHKKHTQLQKITDNPLTVCPHCKENALKRGPGGGFAISFEGSGFYSTDYPKSEGPPSPSEKKSCCPCSGKHSCGA